MRIEPTCAEVQEAISASLDGEEPNLDHTTVDRHIATCEACAAFGDAASGMHAAVRVRPAPDVPDRTRAILAAASAPDRAPLWLAVRLALAAVAVVEGVIFMPAFLYGNDGEGVPTHAARHLGAFGLAFAVALLVVAIRPRQARSLVPMTVTLTVAMMAAAIVDTI
ncbi:MAG TPA: zf-HC2 domain-containing protein, partial [Acidimicrobiia bacterium]